MGLLESALPSLRRSCVKDAVQFGFGGFGPFSLTPSFRRLPVQLACLFVLAVLSLEFVAPGIAQTSQQRTWPELKAAVQDRADRDAYPLTGTKAEEVKEILSRITSLDRDEWARAWSEMGDRHLLQAEKLPA